MSFHHLALATRDVEATHRFYTEAVGFDLAHVEVVDLPNGAWFRHLFYDTGNGELLAIFDLHDDEIVEYRTDISTGLGLPSWVNHIAFGADDDADIDRHKQRLLDHGHDCVIADHGNAVSLYAEDPNGITIEFAYLRQPIVTEENRRRAAELVLQAKPLANGTPPELQFFTAQPVAFSAG